MLSFIGDPEMGKVEYFTVRCGIPPSCSLEYYYWELDEVPLSSARKPRESAQLIGFCCIFCRSFSPWNALISLGCIPSRVQSLVLLHQEGATLRWTPEAPLILPGIGPMSLNRARQNKSNPGYTGSLFSATLLAIVPYLKVGELFWIHAELCTSI